MSTVSEIDREINTLQARKERIHLRNKMKSKHEGGNTGSGNAGTGNAETGNAGTGNTVKTSGGTLVDNSNFNINPRIQKMIMDGGFNNINENDIPQRILDMSEDELIHKVKKYERKIMRLLDQQNDA